MSTEFFVSDERYMSEDEIADANKFDESALICVKSVGPRRRGGQGEQVFELEIENMSFYTLPRDVKLINNNNNLEIKTIGDLVDATRKSGSRIMTRHEVEQASKVDFAELRQLKRFEGILPKQLPPSRSRVVEYIRRGNQKTS